MGNVFYYTLKTELKNPSEAEDVYKLSNGSISSLMETNNGWVFYKSGSSLSEETDTDTVKEYMLKYELGKIEDYLQQRQKVLKFQII